MTTSLSLSTEAKPNHQHLLKQNTPNTQVRTRLLFPLLALAADPMGTHLIHVM